MQIESSNMNQSTSPAHHPTHLSLTSISFPDNPTLLPPSITLTHLSISCSSLPTCIFQLIADNYPNLTHLALPNCMIDYDHMIQFVEQKSLVRLDLSNNVITNSSIKVMLQCQMKRLRELDLAGNPINQEGLKRLIERFPKLTYLNLPLPDAKDFNFKCKTKIDYCIVSKNLPNLLYLSLTNSNLTNSSVNTLTHSLLHLTSLDLCSNPLIGDEGAKHISSRLCHLIDLNINETSVADEGIIFIARHMKCLKRLSAMCLITEIGALEIWLRMKNMHYLAIEKKLKALGKKCKRRFQGYGKSFGVMIGSNNLDSEVELMNRLRQQRVQDIPNKLRPQWGDVWGIRGKLQ